MDREYDDIRVINEDDYIEEYYLWKTGINPLNITYTDLNNFSSILLGNVTYVSSEDPVPEIHGRD